MGADAAVIAVDGTAAPPFEPKPGCSVGQPARRVVRAPAEGAIATLSTSASPCRSTGAPRRHRAASQHTSFDPQPLRAGRIPEPDLATAERLSFTFAPADGDAMAIAVSDTSGGLPLGPICTSSDKFWTINGRAWPGRDHSVIPPPLAVLERGRSYVFELKNGSPLLHPIHIHGHTFKVLKSTPEPAVYHADTVVLTPEGRSRSRSLPTTPADGCSTAM